MNTTKLYTIAKLLKDKLNGTETLVQQVVLALQEQTKYLEQANYRLQQSDYHKQLTDSLDKLYKKIEKSSVDKRDNVLRDAMEELGVVDEFGEKLEERVKNIIERNQITQQTAFDEMRQLHTKVRNTETNLKGLVSALEYFNVSEDELKADEHEVGLVIPRKYVKDNLKEFGTELTELEKLFLVFSELVTGKREPLIIRQISSSDLSIFLNYKNFKVVACIATMVSSIFTLITTIRDDSSQIMEKKEIIVKLEVSINNEPTNKPQTEEKLAKQKISDAKKIKSKSAIDNLLKDHIDDLAKEKIEQIKENLMDEYGIHLDSSIRKKELSNELGISLNKLANRFDRGFKVKFRKPEQVQNEEEESTDENMRAKKIARQQIIDSASRIQYPKQVGKPVLFLKEREHGKPPENEDGKQA